MYLRLSLFSMLVTGAVWSASAQTLPSQDDVLEVVERVNNHWMNANPGYGDNRWAWGAYYTGAMRAWEGRQDPAVWNYINGWGESFDWTVYYRSSEPTHADEQCAGQTFIDMFRHEGNVDTNKIVSIANNVQIQLDRPEVDDWWWIDALYMSAPVYARLGSVFSHTNYYEKMYAMYHHTAYERVTGVTGVFGLFDPVERLWYRDASYVYPRAQAANGEKLFWGRGNGWVFGSLARVLDELPADEPHRAEYEQVFTNMAAKLALIQKPDGYWGANLLDPDDPDSPETSGTAFFTYGLAWGVNNGLLDRATYEPCIARAWNGMVANSVHANGLLGWTQDGGSSPYSSPGWDDSSTAPYGVGAFLLAGIEVALMHGEILPDVYLLAEAGDFNNPGGTDAGLSSVGWTALATLDSTGLNGSASDEVTSAGISRNDYSFFAPQLGILDNELFLTYTTHANVQVDVARVKRVHYSYIGDPTDAVYRVAIRVDGIWYAEATGTADTRDNPGPGGAFLNASFAPASFVAATNWATVQNASVGAAPMTLGAAPAGDLSGTVTAIGLLLDGGAGDGDHVRFDAFEVTAAAATEPTVQLSSAIVSENTAVGTEVGVLSMAAADDWTAPITYAFNGGADDTSFTISGIDTLTASLETTEIFDRETRDTYTIEIRATDSSDHTTNRVFTITVGNLAEPGGAMAARAEVQAGTTWIGTLEALPGSGDSSVTYGVNAATYHGAMFEIQDVDNLHLKAAPDAGAIGDAYFAEVTASGNSSGPFAPFLLKVTVVDAPCNGTIILVR